jgi:hypothetical protein
MSSLHPVAWERLGVRFQENGQVVLRGRALELLEAIDRQIMRIAERFGADELRCPTFVSAAELHKLDYFRSFPHLVSFPVSLEPSDANLSAFTGGPLLNEAGELALTATTPVREVLTPAACYHVYIEEQGRDFAGPRYYTTRNTCFRRETHYQPLRRQWAFSMREVVCVGSLDDVRRFLEDARKATQELLDTLGIGVQWDAATDPFFQPSKQPRYVAQRVNPTKFEAVFDGDLAIASLNLHQDHFGHTYQLRCRGETAFTGCLAFGLERWLHAWARTCGEDAHFPGERVERFAPASNGEQP